jgi:hypothetical protein
MHLPSGPAVEHLKRRTCRQIIQRGQSVLRLSQSPVKTHPQAPDRRFSALAPWPQSGQLALGMDSYALATSRFEGHDSCVATAEDEKKWLRQFSNPDSDEPMDPAWRLWLQALYADRGALSPAEVEPLAEAELLNRARDAGRLVAADASGTLGQPADITAGVHFERVRVVVNGEIANGSGLMSFDPSELLVEVADAAQEIIMDDCVVWPECPSHNAGLHPELVDGEGVWVCRVGGHTIARIGHLGEASPLSSRAAKRLERRRNRR